LNDNDRFRGCLIGLAVGDALGTTVEFKRRGTFPPVTTIVGGGPFGLEPGQWTDDTSMALCLAESLIEKGFDLADQIERYCAWHQTGYWSSTGWCFDIGHATWDALERYKATGAVAAGSVDPATAGNGCIMRLAPVPIYFYPDDARAAEYAGRSSLTTHGETECVEAARILSRVLISALAGSAKIEVLTAGTREQITSPRLARIAAGASNGKQESEIVGSGYVVDCLEAALWCFANTESFADAVLRAVNLGDDADTTGAVCGQIAGAFYGEHAIPEQWRTQLHRGNDIRELAERLRERKAKNEALRTPEPSIPKR
jgi:ADP-ribosyl-[dinitrogen reductase] hydrolase